MVGLFSTPVSLLGFSLSPPVPCLRLSLLSSIFKNEIECPIAGKSSISLSKGQAPPPYINSISSPMRVLPERQSSSTWRRPTFYTKLVIPDGERDFFSLWIHSLEQDQHQLHLLQLQLLRLMPNTERERLRSGPQPSFEGDSLYKEAQGQFRFKMEQHKSTGYRIFDPAISSFFFSHSQSRDEFSSHLAFATGHRKQPLLTLLLQRSQHSQQIPFKMKVPVPT